MIREIITYPDKRLKMRSIEVSEFNNELHFLLNDMLDTMIDKMVSVSLQFKLAFQNEFLLLMFLLKQIKKIVMATLKQNI